MGPQICCGWGVRQLLCTLLTHSLVLFIFLPLAVWGPKCFQRLSLPPIFFRLLSVVEVKGAVEVRLCWERPLVGSPLLQAPHCAAELFSISNTCLQFECRVLTLMLEQIFKYWVKGDSLSVNPLYWEDSIFPMQQIRLVYAKQRKGKRWKVLSFF